MALTLYDPGPSYTKFDQIEGITKEERSFLRIVDVNAFGNRAKGNSGLYATICRINHSCAPNAYHISDHLGVMEVNAMVRMTGRMMMMTGKHGKNAFRNKSGK